MADENQTQQGGLENLVGAIFLGASIALSSHSTIRMAIVRAGNKMIYFPIINVAMLANEFSAVLMILSSSGALGNQWNLWAQTASNLAYFVTKPILLYLAFLRCRAVFEPYRKYPTVHYFMVGLRSIELFVVLIVNVYDNIRCQGLTLGSACHQVDSVWKIRDGMAPAFRFYYIFSEGTFYVKLFQTLDLHGDDLRIQRLLRLRRYQISIFTFDLLFLISMSVYRILVLANYRLPSYVYTELFSTALTVFVMTEFGLTLTKLFRPSSSDEVSTNVIYKDKITIPQNVHLSQEMKKPQHSTPSLKTNTFGLVKPTNVNSINASASYTCHMNEYEEYDKFDELYSYYN
ncbi:16291_t:CDS:1 [Acaulospora morrowiae]|uniref:16291_t:CDS:1 n=1 Tax=Acaulospora morrowiae TaxID=94023 RepID=A0A9N9CAK2_9GLOM|nr:16291_t:CDS:1 [Acaulospora morrowiae]